MVIKYFLITIFLVIAAYIDFKKHIIPNWLNLSFFVLRFALIPLYTLDMFHIYGAIFGFAMFFIPALLLKQDIGGDIKMATVLGIWLGIEDVILVLTLSALLALVYMLIKKSKGIPFAPSTLIAFLLWLGFNLISYSNYTIY